MKRLLLYPGVLVRRARLGAALSIYQDQVVRVGRRGRKDQVAQLMVRFFNTN
jgi:hypothetical protein